MESTGAEPSSEEEELGEHYVAHTHGFAFVLKRREFPTLDHYLYARMWCDFVVEETRAEQQTGAEDLEGQKRLEKLIKSGQCVTGSKVVKVEQGKCDFQWHGKQGWKFQENMHIIISQSDPDVDKWKHPATISQKQLNGCILNFLGDKVPPEIFKFEWRLDMSFSDVEMHKHLACIRYVAARKDNPFTEILMDDPLQHGSMINTINLPDDDIASMQEDIQKIAMDHYLNEEQQRVLHAAVRQHITLVQGPPGTGKSRSVCAIVALFEKLGG